MRDTLKPIARWSSLLGAGLLLLSPVARASNPDSLVDDGEAAEKAGNVDKAIENYQEALKDSPGHEGAALDLSLVYRRAEQYDKAIAVLNKALEANPTSVRIANNLGVCYRLNKQYDAAETVFRAALARSPGNVDTYKNMAVLFYDQDKLALAEQFSIEAKKLNDKDSGIWNNLGLIYFKKDGADKPTRALGAFKHAVELNPKDETAWLNIGAISLRYRDYGSAEKAFENAVNIDSESYQNHLWHAYALDGGKKYDDAIKEYDNAFAKKSDLYEVYYAKGMIYQSQQKWPEALEQCKKFLETKPEDQAKLDKTNACVKSAQYMVDLKNKPPEQSSPIGQPSSKQDDKKPEEKKPEGSGDAAPAPKAANAQPDSGAAAPAAKPEGATPDSGSAAPAPKAEGAQSDSGATGGTEAAAVNTAPSAAAH